MQSFEIEELLRASLDVLYKILMVSYRRILKPKREVWHGSDEVVRRTTEVGGPQSPTYLGVAPYILTGLPPILPAFCQSPLLFEYIQQPDQMLT